jgi:hypothetical protein
MPADAISAAADGQASWRHQKARMMLRPAETMSKNAPVAGTRTAVRERKRKPEELGRDRQRRLNSMVSKKHSRKVCSRVGQPAAGTRSDRPLADGLRILVCMMADGDN